MLNMKNRVGIFAPFTYSCCWCVCVCVYWRGGVYSSIIRLSPRLLTLPMLTFTPTVFAYPSGLTAGKDTMLRLMVLWFIVHLPKIFFQNWYLILSNWLCKIKVCCFCKLLLMYNTHISKIRCTILKTKQDGKTKQKQHTITCTFQVMGQ